MAEEGDKLDFRKNVKKASKQAVQKTQSRDDDKSTVV